MECPWAGINLYDTGSAAAKEGSSFRNLERKLFYGEGAWEMLWPLEGYKQSAEKSWEEAQGDESSLSSRLLPGISLAESNQKLQGKGREPIPCLVGPRSIQTCLLGRKPSVEWWRMWIWKYLIFTYLFVHSHKHCFKQSESYLAESSSPGCFYHIMMSWWILHISAHGSVSSFNGCIVFFCTFV